MKTPPAKPKTRKARPAGESRPAPASAADLPPGVDAALTMAQVMAALGVRRTWIMAARSSGEFPQPDFPIGVAPRWRVSTVNAWMDRRVARHKAGGG